MNDFYNIEKITGFEFKNKDLLRQAFIHRSYINENLEEKMGHNERLELLGDAVLELITTEILYAKYPSMPEGDLTSLRAALVRGRHLADVARELSFGEFLMLSKGEENSGGREKNYILANALESFLGALYLDQGYKPARKFIEQKIAIHVDNILNHGLYVDSKTLFQEIAQDKLGITPEYKLIEEKGPDHDKIFTMGVYLEEALVAEGDGSSKQKAEVHAAEKAIEVKGWDKESN
jgi:ribonuclease-3